MNKYVHRTDLDAASVSGRSIKMPHWLDENGNPQPPDANHPPDIVESPTLEVMTRHGYLPVNDPAPPAHDEATQKADPLPRIEISGEAQRQWQIVSKTAEERAEHAAEESERQRRAYRDARRTDYVAQLGQDPGFDNTVGDVLDTLIREVRALRPQTEQNPDFKAMLAQIDAIKARHPRQ